MSRHDINTVLVVDDEESILRLVKRTLQTNKKIATLTALDTKTAFDTILEKDVDLILIDINFHKNDTDGIEFVRHIREKGYDGLICMYTGSTEPKQLFQAALAGADDYLTKGPSLNLSVEIGRLLDRKTRVSELKKEIDPITDCAFLRSLGLGESQTKLLSDFASLGYPRIKEFACQLGVTETSVWKRLSRIKTRLNMDSLTQMTYLLAAISAFGQTPQREKSLNDHPLRKSHTKKAPE